MKTYMISNLHNSTFEPDFTDLNLCVLHTHPRYKSIQLTIQKKSSTDFASPTQVTFH